MTIQQMHHVSVVVDDLEAAKAFFVELGMELEGEGHESDGVHTLVLATTGRTSGEPRRTCLIYGTSGDDFAVVASKGGADEDPDWFKNLQADPGAGVQVGTRRFTGRARVASPGRTRGPLAADGAHLPALRRVRAEDRPRDPDRSGHPSGMTHTTYVHRLAPLPSGGELSAVASDVPQ